MDTTCLIKKNVRAGAKHIQKGLWNLIQKSSRRETADGNKKPLLLIVMIGFSFCLSFADSFTDAIQDLAVQTACIGKYSATEAGGGWEDDPHDYYTPQIMAGRFARMSGI